MTDRHSGASDEVKKNEELLFKEVRDLNFHDWWKFVVLLKN